MAPKPRQLADRMWEAEAIPVLVPLLPMQGSCAAVLAPEWYMTMELFCAAVSQFLWRQLVGCG